MDRVRYGLIVVAGCAFLLMLASAAVIPAVRHTNELADAQEYVGDKLYGVRQVYEMLLSMESSQRGYLLTGNLDYLAPYLRKTVDFDNQTMTAERLFQGDDEARPIIVELLKLARAKHFELTETIALARAGNREGAMAIVDQNLGKELMDQLEAKLLTLIAEQRAVRTRLVDEGRATLRYVYLLGAGIGVLILTLVAFAVRSLTVSIARLDRAQKTEEHNAMHDALTGLPNRRYLGEWMTTALAAARRAGHELHVLYFDLDGFKAVNDRLGHEAGDAVLSVTASRLRNTLRSSDFVARLGGDEFVAVLPQTDAPPSVGALIERLEQALTAAPIEELSDGAVTASIGRSSFPRDGDTVPVLLAAADRSMYNIKEARNLARQSSNRGSPPGRQFGQQQPA